MVTLTENMLCAGQFISFYESLCFAGPVGEMGCLTPYTRGPQPRTLQDGGTLGPVSGLGGRKDRGQVLWELRSKVGLSALSGLQGRFPSGDEAQGEP